MNPEPNIRVLAIIKEAPGPVRGLYTVEQAACADGIHHTSFLLMPSGRENEFIPFPVANFCLTSQEARDAIHTQLKSLGKTLREPGSPI